MSYKIIKNRPETRQFRKKLRNYSSIAEIKLWMALKNRKLNGTKFRRQYGVEKYSLDFYCSEEKLSVELDGDTHDNPSSYEYDLKRTEVLNSYGIREIRFLNKDVHNNLEGILQEIRNNFRK